MIPIPPALAGTLLFVSGFGLGFTLNICLTVFERSAGGAPRSRFRFRPRRYSAQEATVVRMRAKEKL